MEKYYYPDIEEIRIGWEGEVNDALGYKEEYIPFKIKLMDEEYAYCSNIDDLVTMIDDGYGEVRVPFLTKEQIEAEGWKYKSKSIDLWFEKEGNFDMLSWTAYRAVLQYGLHDHRLRIYMEDCGNEHTVFEGICPDINTFRTIIKLVVRDAE
jgi:hypothetical protein